MSSDEQKQVLKMVENGILSAEEAIHLIKALELPDQEGTEIIETTPAFEKERKEPEFEEVKARARRFAAIPLLAGILVTVFSSYWLFRLVQSSNYGFWFAFAWLPLLLGVLMITLAAGGLNVRWLYVNVDQEQGEWPRHFTFGLPLPLGLAAWALRNFGHYIRGMEHVRVEEILSLLELTTLQEPLIVNVDEGEHGERVQVYIG